MQAIIIIVTIILLFIAIAWSINNLGDITKGKKALYIIISLIILYVITLIEFSISKSGLEYQNIESMKIVKNVLVSIFTAVNAIIVMPYISKIIGQVSIDDIDKDVANKKIIFILIVFVICLFIECGYLSNIQEGIIKIYASK